MFKTVIVPLNGSRQAERAIPYAVAEARRHGATLRLVRVVVRPESACLAYRGCGPAPRPVQWPAEVLDQEVRQALAYLAGVKERYTLPATTAIRVYVGEPVRQLTQDAAGCPAPLLVLTNGGASAPAPEPMSEMVRRLMVSGVAPVLAVREPAPSEAAPRAHDVVAAARSILGNDALSA